MENRSLTFAALVLALLIGAGAAIGGFFIGRGFYQARAERYFVSSSRTVAMRLATRDWVMPMRDGSAI